MTCGLVHCEKKSSCHRAISEEFIHAHTLFGQKKLRSIFLVYKIRFPFQSQKFSRMILISNFPHFILIRFKQINANNWKFKLQIIHVVQHSGVACRWIFVRLPSTVEISANENLALPSSIATKNFQASVRDRSYIWSCWGTQILTVRITWVNFEGTFSSTCFVSTKDVAWCSCSMLF